MSKAEFQQVRTLIQQHQYDEARALLQQLRHPKATEWLAKLDEIDPAIEFPHIPSPRPAGRIKTTLSVTLVLVCSIAIVYILGTALSANKSIGQIFSLDGPEHSTQQWLQGLLGGDATLVGHYTCSSDINDISSYISNQGLLRTAFEIFGGFDVETDIDMADMTFLVVGQGSDRATVHGSGKIRTIVNDTIDESEIDQSFPLTYEDGRWKVCPSHLPQGIESTDIPQVDKDYKIDVIAFRATNQGNGWVEGTIVTSLTNISNKIESLEKTEYLRAITEGGYVETEEGITYDLRNRLAKERAWTSILPGYSITCGTHITFTYSEHVHPTRVVFPNAPEFNLNLEDVAIQQSGVSGTCAELGLANPSQVTVDAQPIEALIGQEIAFGTDDVTGSITRIDFETEEVWGDRSSLAINLEIPIKNHNLYQNTEFNVRRVNSYIATPFGQITAAGDQPNSRKNGEVNLGSGQEETITLRFYHIFDILPLRSGTYYFTIGLPQKPLQVYFIRIASIFGKWSITSDDMLIAPESHATEVSLSENVPSEDYDAISFSMFNDNLQTLSGWRNVVEMEFEGMFSGTSRQTEAATRAEIWYNQLDSARREVMVSSGDLLGLTESATIETVQLGSDTFQVRNGVCLTEIEAEAEQAAQLGAGTLIDGVTQAFAIGQQQTINNEIARLYDFAQEDLNLSNNLLGDTGQISLIDSELWVATEHEAVVRYHLTVDVENANILGSALPVSGRLIIRYNLYDIGELLNLSVPFGC